MRILSLSSHAQLADQISHLLNTPLMDIAIRHYEDSEIFIQLREDVRGEVMFVLQTLCCPTNDHVMELLLTLDTLRRSAAKRIIPIIPYFGYARQDRKLAPGSSLSAKLLANLIQTAGADELITIDWHSQQLEGFFDIPVHQLSLSGAFAQRIQKDHNLSDVVIISPDLGGVGRARSLANKLETPLVVLEKNRQSPTEMQIVRTMGEIQGKICIITDDLVDSAATLCTASDHLMTQGAKEVHAVASHGVLSGTAMERIDSSSLKSLILGDTIPLPPESSSKISQISVSNLIISVIENIT